ncbi:hypothetical protein BB559_006613 [Furculomyces boomerangus]|uniref:Peptidase S1 domain-containing protein n=1 Tax=Furculomyces boomerangus TaxID=61424 RepID=A0A2T9Y1J5_9FUNG|nr:hypothetical protein BB559_006613 [Furculomyces boomerangus]
MNLILGSLLLFSILQATHTYGVKASKIANTKQLSENTKRISKRGSSDRILNGNEVEFSEYSSAASLLSLLDNGTSCTGTFISKDVVLTAAHCVYNTTTGPLSPGDVLVSGGTKSILQNITYIYKVEKVLVHSDYNSSKFSNDIALLFLTNSTSDPSISFAKIYNIPVSDETPVEAAGWGSTTKDSSSGPSQVLMAVPIHISSSEDCKEGNVLWESNNGPTICMMVQNEQDTCPGDSGGPLYFTGDSSKPIVGITSFEAVSEDSSTNKCGNNGDTAYFTNALYYIDWILSNTQIDAEDLVFDKDYLNSPTSNSSSASQSTSASKPTSEIKTTSTSQSTFKSQSSTTNASPSATLSINIYTTICTIFLLYNFIA